MVKKLVLLLILGLVTAMPTTALAGADWKGITADWDDYATNWDGNPINAYQTEKASFDPGDVAWLGGTMMPTIDSSDNTEWGFARARNGAVITQIGGFHQWMNGTGTSNWSLNIYAGASLDMTGGKHRASTVSLGAYNAGATSGVGTVNVWGTGVFSIRDNPYVAGLSDLYMAPGSMIDIRDSGSFEVPVDLAGTIDGYIDGGQIVAGEAGYMLDTQVVGNEYFVTAVQVPEPGTLLLLGMGLGCVALIRRRHA